ncbi:MAG: hypothetical protein IT472_09985 [Thermomonas sp.]|uniref:hypothetical protein n=1 Tax=Thermomonas sp. TaxID=1971895 RepID=UPI00262494BE|nr:hypothetical protein [Thermomonas sp.]MCC7097494.1 hypothetical protein [Thermomonas sp.]
MKLLSGFILLVGGTFLAVAWMCWPQQMVDAHRYAPFTATAHGRIVDGWLALDFDPAKLPKDSRRWQPYATIQACVLVAYAERGRGRQRAFCGNRFSFSDDFRIDNWDTLAPGVPFAFLRDGSGIQIPQMRMSKRALEWLSTHPPYDTFMLGKPAPTTALAALREQYDRPLTFAIASWSRTDTGIPLRYDPRRPTLPMPSGIVEARRTGGMNRTISLIVTLILGAIGVFAWRAGIRLLTGQSGVLLWALILLPLLALPWWSDVLPRMLRHVNSDAADIAQAMLDDINRVSRLTASAPADALLVNGERLQWTRETGFYADSFGKLRLRLPQPQPATPEAAFIELQSQAREAVGKLDAPARVALFVRLRNLHDAGHDDVQRLFTPAAEATLRDASADARARRAAREFLIFASGAGYSDDQLDHIERTQDGGATVPGV